MPKTKLGTVKRDKAKELIRGRQKSCGYTNEKMGSFIDLSEWGYIRLMKKGSEEWPVWVLFALARGVDISKDEIKSCI